MGWVLRVVLGKREDVCLGGMLRSSRLAANNFECSSCHVHEGQLTQVGTVKATRECATGSCPDHRAGVKEESSTSRTYQLLIMTFSHSIGSLIAMVRPAQVCNHLVCRHCCFCCAPALLS